MGRSHMDFAVKEKNANAPKFLFILDLYESYNR